MTLFINARFLTQPISGVQRYAIELLTALDRKLQDDERLRTMLGPVVAFHPGSATFDPGWKAMEVKHLPGGSGISGNRAPSGGPAAKGYC